MTLRSADFKSDITVLAGNCRMSHSAYIVLIIIILILSIVSHDVAKCRTIVRYKVSPQVSPENLRTSLDNEKPRSGGVPSGAISRTGRVHDNGQARGAWLATSRLCGTNRVNERVGDLASFQKPPVDIGVYHSICQETVCH
jgi:hypothetical protein